MKVVWHDHLYIDNGIFLDGRKKTLEKALRSLPNPYDRKKVSNFLYRPESAEKREARKPVVTKHVIKRKVVNPYLKKNANKVVNPYLKKNANNPFFLSPSKN